jgi:hypothetical protein
MRFFRRLNKKIPIRGVVVTLRNLPQFQYPYVDQLTANRLESYILGFRDFLASSEVVAIADYLLRGP